MEDRVKLWCNAIRDNNPNMDYGTASTLKLIEDAYYNQAKQIKELKENDLYKQGWSDCLKVNKQALKTK